MPINLYNTLTRKKEPFAPLDPKNVRLYVCGPTVYDYAHIGNARPVVVFDTLFRLLRHLYAADRVTYVRNITDVDDKIIKVAADNNEPIAALTARTAKAYEDDMAKLGALTPTHQPRCTQTIPQMVALIEILVAKDFAYPAEGHVLFHVPAMAEYGQLSRRSLDDMIAGARVEVAPYKKHPADFVLWKPSTPEQPGWDSPWGRGRPGWHIECSAMAKELLGITFDIHGGGQDLIFPHHENEIAQSEAYCGKPFANYWCENGLVNLSGAKMSKSEGNFFFIEDIARDRDPEVTRFYLMSTHYRSPIEFSTERLQEASVAYARLRGPLERGAAWTATDGAAPGGSLGAAVTTAERLFHESMQDDFNTAGALGHLFDLARAVNRAFDEGGGSEAVQGARALYRLGAILGLFWRAPSADTWPAEVLALAAQREGARKSRNWKLSDELRDQLAALGVAVEDAQGGQKLRRK